MLWIIKQELTSSLDDIMVTIDEQILEIEEEIKKTPYNKATQHHIGKLKAKLARLSDEADKRKSKKGDAKGYGVKKSGHATVVLVGMPSVGKSTLLNCLTEAESEVGAYHFTTLKVVPGVMRYKEAIIQILDLPGLVKGAAKGKGRGREVLSVARAADLVVLLMDVYDTKMDVLVNELVKGGIRMNQTAPDVVLIKKEKGGVSVSSTVKLTILTEETIAAIVREYGHVSADIILREDITEDRLIDAMAGNRVYMPAIVVVNKIDLASSEQLDDLKKNLTGFPIFYISAEKKEGISELKNVIYDKLDFIRIYMKPQGKKADLTEPLVIKKDSSVGDVCDFIHRTFKSRFRYANVWGSSAKFPGQTVGMRHMMEDGDILTIVVSK
jgi:small GTP-binding protein